MRGVNIKSVLTCAATVMLAAIKYVPATRDTEAPEYNVLAVVITVLTVAKDEM